ncbi:unnamed protein product [Durusdinium trenchii]|uniref:Uncharacterized protein n=1 Tax=Durusdinium trenchii TaxID=1381693 RepID=A0ABP0KN76_9DINO
MLLAFVAVLCQQPLEHNLEEFRFFVEVGTLFAQTLEKSPLRLCEAHHLIANLIQSHISRVSKIWRYYASPEFRSGLCVRMFSERHTKKTTLVSSPEFPGVFFGEAEAGALSLSSSLGLKAAG